MVKNDELNYPNLQFCSILPALSVGTSHVPPSVSVNPKCLQALSTPIPAVYDFEIETTVVEKYVNAENTEQSPLTREPPQQRQGISTEFNPSQREMLKRMRSVTNASDEICSSILKRKNFDLNSSIDSYFLGER